MPPYRMTHYDHFSSGDVTVDEHLATCTAQGWTLVHMNSAIRPVTNPAGGNDWYLLHSFLWDEAH